MNSFFVPTNTRMSVAIDVALIKALWDACCYMFKQAVRPYQ